MVKKLFKIKRYLDLDQGEKFRFCIQNIKWPYLKIKKLFNRKLLLN